MKSKTTSKLQKALSFLKGNAPCPDCYEKCSVMSKNLTTGDRQDANLSRTCKVPKISSTNAQLCLLMVLTFEFVCIIIFNFFGIMLTQLHHISMNISIIIKSYRQDQQADKISTIRPIFPKKKTEIK